MSKQKPASAAAKAVTIRMRKSHRIAVYTLSALMIVCMLAAMGYMISAAGLGCGTVLLLCAAGTIPFLPLPLYYATWQIVFDMDGIHKRLFGIAQKCRPWTQVREVRSAWSSAERSQTIRILFKDGKAIRFRMDCEHAEKARKRILAHCSIRE